MFSRTVDGVLSSVNKSIARLEALSEKHTAHADKKIEQVQELHRQAREHYKQSGRATRVARKLKDLVS